MSSYCRFKKRIANTMSNEVHCIRHTGTIEEADLIVAWLDEQGIEATIVGRDSTDVIALGVTDKEGIAICVPDAATAEKAGALLEQHDAEHQVASTREIVTGPIEVTCEECKQVTSFEGKFNGTVQECSSCGAYVDVGTMED